MGDAPLRPKEMSGCGCSLPWLLLLPDICMADVGKEWDKQPSRWKYNMVRDTAWVCGQKDKTSGKGGFLPKVAR